MFKNIYVKTIKENRKMKKTYLKPEVASTMIEVQNKLMAGSGKATAEDGTSMTISDTGATGEAEGNTGSFWGDED